MCVVGEEVRNDSVRDDIDDIRDTRKIGVSVVREVCEDFVVLGLSVVDLGNALCDRRLSKDTRWCYFGATEEFSCIFF